MALLQPMSLTGSGGALGAPAAINIYTAGTLNFPPTLASRTWPTANLAVFAPIVLEDTVIVDRLGIVNGAAVSGNFDLGVYTSAGSLLISTGSTAQAGITAVQAVDVGNTSLSAGVYFLAVVLNNTTGTWDVETVLDPPEYRALGFMQMTSAFPLPATASLATYASTHTASLVTIFRRSTV